MCPLLVYTNFEEVIKMEEKIKVSLPKTVLDILKKDCQDFRLLKENGQPNMNAFINTLIVNLYEEFSAHEEKLHEEIREAIFKLPEAYKKQVFNDFVKILSKRGEGVFEKKQSATISFKPTKSSKRAIEYIDKVLLKNETVSSFYRRLFISYSQRLKNEREKIIYKENYDIIKKSISKGLAVCITTTSGGVYNLASVYDIAPARDELFNYVLVYNDKSNHTLRLATVDTVLTLSDKAFIPEESKELFKRQIECGAQYPIYPTDKGLIKVKLSEHGKYLFKKIYLYRPVPISIEDDIYTFNCSRSQVLYYFERFGDSALILSPKKLGQQMRDFHYFALKKYRTIYNKD